MNITALDTPESELGEGIFIDEKYMHLYWVDISKSKLFQYDLKSNKLIRIYDLGLNPSCIFSIVDGLLTYADRDGIKQFCTKKWITSHLISYSEHNPMEFRANDGVKLPNGCMIFGTMSFRPDKSVGKIYTLRENDYKIKSHELGIHIPNTFINYENRIYISDSLLKHTYLLNLENLEDIENITKDDLILWKDFSNFDYTPDGGCISKKGYLHIALWDGAAIGIYDKDGTVIDEIALPVLKPTSCALLDSRWLYVTSAREGMTKEQLLKYPLAGKTLLVDLGVDYEY